jgi:hypothetical protein
VLASGKTVLRGGFGMTHDRTQGNLIFNTVFDNPAIVQTASVGSGDVSSLPTLQSSFGNGVLSNIVGASRDGKVPTVSSFSLGVQRDLGKGMMLDVAYVGTLSRHLVTSRDINAEPYGTLFSSAAQDPNCSIFSGSVPAVQPNLQPQYSAAGYDFNGWCAYGAANYENNYLVPYKGYGQISYLEFGGTANYNSLEVSLQRRFSRGLTFGAVYTYSKALTTAVDDQDSQDPFNPLLEALQWTWVAFLHHRQLPAKRRDAVHDRGTGRPEQRLFVPAGKHHGLRSVRSDSLLFLARPEWKSGAPSDWTSGPRDSRPFARRRNAKLGHVLV